MEYYNQIKTELINNEVYKKVKDYSKNRNDLKTYYKVGKLLNEAGKHYGERIIKQYAVRLVLEVKKKYDERTLRRIRQFYETFKDENWSTMSTNLSWSHYVELLGINDMDKIHYYIYIANKNNLTVRELRGKIKSKEFERLPEKSRNKMLLKKEFKIEDSVKNPIIIKDNHKYNKFSEKILQKLILEDISSFMKELGIGFSFIQSEYKIKLGNRYNYIDFLLFNYKYNCFVVIELKITDLKAEHIGQIKKYMNYIDKNVKDIYQNKTVGIIICRRNNEYVMEYCSDESVLTKEYVLN